MLSTFWPYITSSVSSLDSQNCKILVLDELSWQAATPLVRDYGECKCLEENL